VLAGVPESHGPDRRLDTRGLVLVGGAGFAAVWALVRGNEVGWGDPQIVVAAVGAAVLGAAFVAWERRAPAPMLPLRFFAARGFSAGTAAAFLLNAALYASVFFMAQYLQAGLGHDALAAGLRLVPWTATLLVVAPLAGALADRYGPRPVLATGLAVQAVGLAWLGLVAEPGLGYAAIVGPVVVAGVGCSAAIPVAQAAVVGAVGEADVGKAAGANNMLQELGGAVGVAVAVAAFAGAGSYAGAAAFTDGFAAAMAAAVALSALAFVAALLLPRRPAGAGRAGPR
jgi:predicted MFS family arabinose efflux permease